MTKTFLIIDDQAYCFSAEEMNASFLAAGIDAEIRVSGTHGRAFDIIREWKDRGLKLDIITHDIRAAYDNQGVEALEAFLDSVAQEIGSDMLPQNVFLHSADWNPTAIKTKYGVSPSVIHDGEISALEDEQGIYNDSCRARGSDLRTFLNANWGTKFVKSEAEEKILKNPNSQLSPDDVDMLLYEKAIEPKRALRLIKLNNPESFIERAFIQRKGDKFEDEPCTLRFSSGVQGTVAGLVAYNTEDIKNIKEQSSREPVILVLQSAANYELPPQGIDALVVLNDDVHAVHIKQVCENMGIPALIGAKQDRSWGEYKYTHQDGLFFSQYDGKKQSGILKAGSGLTLEAYNDSGNLYAGKFPLVYGENHRISNYKKIIAVADSELTKHGIFVRSNADTVEQVEESIKTGADGIGLVRTEHMFFDPQKKIILRNIFLADPQSLNDHQASISAFHKIQCSDFCAILKSAGTAERNFPVTIRLLDAPPNEFMSKEETSLFETRVGKGNTRGVQAGLRINGLYEAQISALCQAFSAVSFRYPLNLLVPNVSTEIEMDEVREMFNRHAQGSGIILSPMVESRKYVSSLIERPHMSYKYISYGTNDLTSELMGGIVRNDTPQIITWMNDHNIHGRNPFLSLMAPVKAEITKLQNRADAPRATICGQQVAKDEDSIRWATNNGLSFSVPFRSVPYVKMVAGQELLKRNAL